jgi:hypothetical protein
VPNLVDVISGYASILGRGCDDQRRDGEEQRGDGHGGVVGHLKQKESYNSFEMIIS